MIRNKLITGITVIMTIILSVVFISYNAKGITSVLSTDDLQEMIDNPTYNRSLLEERYNILSRYYIQIKTHAKYNEVDTEEIELFKQAAESVKEKIQTVYGPDSQIKVNDINSWIEQTDNIKVEYELDPQDLVNIRDSVSTNSTEIQKRYTALQKWYNIFIYNWSFETGKDTTNVQIFRQAVAKLLEYGDSTLTSYQKNDLARWNSVAENIIIQQGGEVEQDTPINSGDYNTIKPNFTIPIGTEFVYSGFQNDSGGNLTPTVLTINGTKVHVFCVDHKTPEGSRLKTLSVKDPSWTDGKVEEYHPGSYCDVTTPADGSYTVRSSVRTDVGKDYYDEPKFKIGEQIDITSVEYDKYQYLGYMLYNLSDGHKADKGSNIASWLAQNAIWLTDINLGYEYMGGPSSDEFQTDPVIVRDTEIINELNYEELAIVEQVAMYVQRALSRGELEDALQQIMAHYERKSSEADTQEMKDFYYGLVHSQDGLYGVYNWVQVQEPTVYFPNIRANVYQYLMTIETPNSTNVRKKIEIKAQEIADSMNVNSGDATLLNGAGALAVEGNAYQEFYQELKANRGVLKVTDKTFPTPTIPLIDRSNGKYAIGPFTIEYNDKYVKSSADSTRRVNFAEIVSMKIYDQNGNYKTYCIDHIDPETNATVPAKQEFKISKSADVWQYDNEYVFPKSNEPFYVIYDSDRLSSRSTFDPDRIQYVEVEFNYIAYYVAELYRTENGEQSRYQWDRQSITHDDTYCSNINCPGHKCYAVRYTFNKKDTARIQYQILIGSTQEVVEKTSIRIPVDNMIIEDDDDDDDDDDTFEHYDEVTMKISGKVFWDQNEGKESIADGLYDINEPLLKNIEVSLYEYDETTGQSVLATLAKGKPNQDGEYQIRLNPTVTDENGEYVFYGVRPMSKYYVQFKYNGQIYQATTFTSQVDEQVSASGQVEYIPKDLDELRRISNAKEFQTEQEKRDLKVDTAIARETYNERLSTIGSAPYNYQSTNSLGYNVKGRTYTQKELMGYKLKGNGNGTYGYERDSSVPQLLDEITIDGELIEGIISKKINEYIYGTGGTLSSPTDTANKKYPNLKTDIYDKIVNEYRSIDPEIKDKLQYIEDIRMTADTTSGDVRASSRVISLMSRYDRFAIGNNNCIIQTGEYYVIGIDGAAVDWVEEVTHSHVGNTYITYHSMYAEQNNVNLGLNERPSADIGLKTDVKDVTVEINGESRVYNEYDARKETDSETTVDGSKDSTWEIGVRLSDVAGGTKYYDQSYSRQLYKSDYLYKASDYNNNSENKDYSYYGKSKSDELEVYVTYTIRVMNQSMSIETSIDEIVDYFDKDYEYIPERSYYTFSRRDNPEERKPLVAEVGSGKSAYISRGADAETTIDGYNNLYIKSLKGEYLTSGKTAYIYVTFRVGKDTLENEDWIKLDEEEDTANPIGVGKENIAEINGYSTRYTAGITVPNVDGSVEYKPAGLTDIDSDPGNLDPVDVPKDGTINYLAFEDDTDKSPNLRLVLYRDHDREIQGIVWEDSRTEEVKVDGTNAETGATIGNGIMEDNETKINGVTVQLVEIMDNGTEFIWRTFENGSGTASIGEYLIGSETKKMKMTTPIISAGRTTNLVSDYIFGDENADISGQYAFKSFPPGNYVIRFIYGDTIKTVLVNSALTSSGDTNTKKSAQITEQVRELYKQLYGEDINGLNAKSYNGQDYKSTTYQKGIEQNGALEIRENHTYTNGNETLGAVLKTIKAYNRDLSNQNESGTYYYDRAMADTNAFVSDAKDIYSNGTMSEAEGAHNIKQAMKTNTTDKPLNTRQDVISYSNNNLMNHIAEILASYRERPQYQDVQDSNMNVEYTNDELKALIDELIDKTQMTAETGLMDVSIEYTGNDANNNQYRISNVNLGLEERPKSQVAIEKEVTNVKLTLSDETVLFDAVERATNVLWQRHQKYNLGYNGNLLDESKFGSIERIRQNNANKFGVVQLSMDEELMHGATIQITYKISAINVGETDYNDTRFYYSGMVSQDTASNKVVTTTVNQVIDYVPNNLQFSKNNNANSQWSLILPNNLISDQLVNNRLESQIKEHNTIISTEALATPLVPTIYKNKVNNSAHNEESVTLVLTQLISPENESDDLTYTNIVEIVRTSNIVGRKNEYSIAGNQNPRFSPQELDSDTAEPVRVLPPFGATATYYALWLAITAVLAIGLGFIVFKVLRRKIRFKL